MACNASTTYKCAGVLLTRTPTPVMGEDSAASPVYLPLYSRAVSNKAYLLQRAYSPSTALLPAIRRLYELGYGYIGLADVRYEASAYAPKFACPHTEPHPSCPEVAIGYPSSTW